MPRVRPAAAVLLDQIGECLRVSGAGVERRDVLEAEAAGAHEGLAILDVDLLERLQAVDGETRAHDADLAQSPGRHAVEHLDRVGLEPTGGTEARLKAHAPCPVRQQQLVRQQASSAVTWSNTAPVVAPQYCGNSGSTRIRCAPEVRSRPSAAHTSGGL